MELSSAASYNPAIPARQDATILPAAQSSAVIGLLFVLPVCTAELNVFPRHCSPPQKHALHRVIGECKSWMSTATMPSRQCRCSASNTVDCVLNDCLLNLGVMFHHLGGIQSVIALGDKQVVCLHCFNRGSIAVHETICKSRHTIHSQPMQCKLCRGTIVVYKKCRARNGMQCSSLEDGQCLLCPRSPRILGELFCKISNCTCINCACGTTYPCEGVQSPKKAFSIVAGGLH